LLKDLGLSLLRLRNSGDSHSKNPKIQKIKNDF
jgi:hypothetical protein